MNHQAIRQIIQDEIEKWLKERDSEPRSFRPSGVCAERIAGIVKGFRREAFKEGAKFVVFNEVDSFDFDETVEQKVKEKYE